MNTTRTHPTAALLAGALRILGYAAGAPFHVLQASRQADMDLCAGLDCDCCGHPGLDYQPYHGPRGEYRALACCPHCGAGQHI